MRRDGSVECWGDDDALCKANPPTGEFTSVSAGWGHTCGVRSDGSVECWGDDDALCKANPPTGEFTSVSAGWGHTCGVRSDGSVECWGSNEDLGGNEIGQATPPQKEEAGGLPSNDSDAGHS